VAHQFIFQFILWSVVTWSNDTVSEHKVEISKSDCVKEDNCVQHGKKNDMHYALLSNVYVTSSS
jgi:hypothetical protein